MEPKEQTNRDLESKWLHFNRFKKCYTWLIGDRPKHPGWKPVTLNPPTLAAVAAVMVLMISVIELLRHLTKTQGGIVFAVSEKDFTPGATFGYLYLPTIVAVAFSMYWNWVDLDVKRLEPFFQLSTSEGATIYSSLYLQYPFDFIATVPSKAIKRRHWSVFTASLITLTIFWGITPLQNSMIATKPVQRRLSVQMSELYDLSKVNEHIDSLSPSFLQDAWESLWYSRDLPAFTTRDYALIPFLPTKSLPVSRDEATIRMPSTKLTTSLECHSAPITEERNSKNCTVSLGVRPDTDQWKVSYCSYTITDPENGGPEKQCSTRLDLRCPRTDQIILMWVGAKPSGPIDNANATAQFCRMKYWAQKVEAVFNYPNMSVIDVSPLSEAERLDKSMFNMTDFEIIVASGAFPSAATPSLLNSYHEVSKYLPPGLVGNAPDIEPLEQWAHNNGTLHIDMDLSPISFFAVQMSAQIDLSKNLDPAILARSYERAQQYLFSIAINKLMTWNSGNFSTQAGQYDFWETGVVLVDPFGVLVEIFLGIIAVLAVVLLVVQSRRHSHLRSDPNSLSRVAKMVENRSSVLSLLDSGRKQAQERTTDDTLRARLTGFSDSLVEKLVINEESDSRQPKILSSQPMIIPKASIPYYLHPLTGIAFTVLLIAVFVLLLTLQQYSTLNDGIPLPSENVIAQQFILNYLPILFATLIEPFWTLLDRTLCLLQPIMELAKLNAEASRSLHSRYTSIPPQLVFLRAFRAKHFYLAVVSCTAMSSNILAVSLGALFAIQDVDQERNVSGHSLFSPKFANTSSLGICFNGQSKNHSTGQHTYQDHFYVLSTNVSKKTELPPWTTSEYFFLPVNNGVPSDQKISNVYEVTTRGFGFYSDCQELHSGAEEYNQSSVSFVPAADGGYKIMASVFIEDSEKMVNCTPPTSPDGKLYSYADGHSAFEFFRVPVDPAANNNTFNQTDIYFSASPCTDWVVAGYGRIHDAHFHNVSFQINPGEDGPCHSEDCSEQRSPVSYGPPLSINSQTYLACRTVMRTGLFAVSINEKQQVLSYRNLTTVTNDVTAYFDDTSDYAKLVTRVNVLNNIETLSGGTAVHGAFVHNGTYARQWFPYMITAVSNSTSSVDPSQSAPAFQDIASQISKVTGRLGAILLSLNQDLILPGWNASTGESKGAEPVSTTVIYYVRETRVFLDPIMYPVTMALLALHIVVAVMFYTRIPLKMLPTLPTTIASQLELFLGSSLLENKSWDPDWVYGYGRFKDAGGVERIGIERAPLVQPLETELPVPFWNVWRSVKAKWSGRQAPMM